MKKSRARRTFLVVAVFGWGSLASVQWSKEDWPLLTLSSSSAMTSDASRLVRRPSCAIVRYYVAKYSANAAEAWARSKGATEADIQKARFCLASANGSAQ